VAQVSQGINPPVQMLVLMAQTGNTAASMPQC